MYLAEAFIDAQDLTGSSAASVDYNKRKTRTRTRKQNKKFPSSKRQKKI